MCLFSVLAVANVDNSFDLCNESLTNTLNGFLFVMSKDGDIIYLSENVERYLGLTYIDLMGQSVYDYSHPCDHDDIKSFLEPLNNSYNLSKTQPKQVERKPKVLSESIGETSGPYFIRMKCTLTNKGRNLNLKSANYKVSCLFYVIPKAILNFILHLHKNTDNKIHWPNG